MAWNKVAYLSEVAALSDVHPLPVDGTAADEGVGIAASREDHVHALGPLVADLDFGQNMALSLVLEVSAGPVDVGTEVEGQIYFDNTALDDHIYIWST